MGYLRRIADAELDGLFAHVPAQAAEADVAHMRTRNGDREVDLIVVPLGLLAP